MANHEGTRWRGQIPIPVSAHPLVRQLIELLNEEQTTLVEAATKAGVSPKTISDWRYRSNPSLDNFQAALNAIGYDLYIGPQKGTHEQKERRVDREPSRPANPTQGQDSGF